MTEVSAFALYLCKDDAESRDLVQETMLKAFLNIASYRSGTNVKAWLFQICRNTFINSTRRKKFERRDAAVTDQEYAVRERDVNGGQYSLCDESFSDEVIHALRSIPKDCQTAVLLCDVEGYSYEEVAALTCTRAGTVRSRIFRGRKALARRLEAYASETGAISPSKPD